MSAQIRIISAPRMVEQFRFPHSKKRRITRKWKKRGYNYRASEEVMTYHSTESERVFVCHPIMVSRIKQTGIWVRGEFVGSDEIQFR